MSEHWWQEKWLWLSLAIAAAVIGVVIVSVPVLLPDSTPPYPPADPSVVRSAEVEIAREPYTLEQVISLTRQRVDLVAAILKQMKPGLELVPSYEDYATNVECAAAPSGVRARMPRMNFSASDEVSNQEWADLPVEFAKRLADRGVRAVVSPTPGPLTFDTDDGFEIELAGWPSEGLILMVTGPCALPSEARDEVRPGG